jgi:hypothetical protein
MERAWQRRSEWQSIGDCANRSIRASVPPDPARALADALVEIVNGEPPVRGLVPAAAEASPMPVEAVQAG